VVLLTAKVDHNSRLEGLQTGADDYLSKPFATDELKVRTAKPDRTTKKLAAKYREEILQPHLQLPLAPIAPSW